MIRRIAIRHFKRFRDQTFDLAESVVLAGPNNAGKSTLLQAVAAWRLGLDRWVAQREGSRAAARSGVAITRGDFTAVPLREMNLLWEDRRVTGLKGMAGERRLNRDRRRGEDRRFCFSTSPTPTSMSSCSVRCTTASEPRPADAEGRCSWPPTPKS